MVSVQKKMSGRERTVRESAFVSQEIQSLRVKQEFLTVPLISCVITPPMQ